ncbi:MAG: hypothetical protein DDT33_01622 [Firmicutes bacterium]|nr:hypothetical protein [Bacillota bacterium]
MKKEPCPKLMRVLIEMVNAVSIKSARPSDEPVNFIALGKKELRQIRAILSGGTGD